MFYSLLKGSVLILWTNTLYWPKIFNPQALNMQIQALEPTQKDIEQADKLKKDLFEGKELIIKPHSYFKDYSRLVLRLFMHKNGIYCLPTQELIDFLKEEIGENSAIEIGAGIGAIGKALKIPTTDNRMQEWEEIKLTYKLTGQPPIEYPEFIEKLEALEAVDKYKPQVVVGAYITNKWLEDKQIGNYWGVDEPVLLQKIKKYIHIGDLNTHAYKPLMNIRHATYYQRNAPWLIIRGKNPFIGIWTN